MKYTLAISPWELAVGNRWGCWTVRISVGARSSFQRAGTTVPWSGGRVPIVDQLPSTYPLPGREPPI